MKNKNHNPAYEVYNHVKSIHEELRMEGMRRDMLTPRGAIYKGNGLLSHPIDDTNITVTDLSLPTHQEILTSYTRCINNEKHVGPSKNGRTMTMRDCSSSSVRASSYVLVSFPPYVTLSLIYSPTGKPTFLATLLGFEYKISEDEMLQSAGVTIDVIFARVFLGVKEDFSTGTDKSYFVAEACYRNIFETMLWTCSSAQGKIS